MDEDAGDVFAVNVRLCVEKVWVNIDAANSGAAVGVLRAESRPRDHAGSRRARRHRHEDGIVSVGEAGLDVRRVHIVLRAADSGRRKRQIPNNAVDAEDRLEDLLTARKDDIHE